MSNEIATYSMILSKLSLGKSGTECPTKTQILAINSSIVIENASTYGANECVKIDDIHKKAETWNYYLTVSPSAMSFRAGGGSKSFTVSSYKRKKLDGVEQSGDTSVSLKSTTISGTGFSLSGTTVSASANEITSNRTGTVTIIQNESNRTVTISLSQDGDDVSSYGEWTISVSASPTSVSSSGGTSTITASAKRTVYWVSGDVTEETGNPTLSTNLGSLSSTSSPSTLTLGENTSTSSRTATITASYSGKSATCTVTQAAGESPDVWDYVFSVNPYRVSVGSGGGSGTVTITSYKTLNGSWYRDASYSIDSSTLPSWATYDGGGSFTISANTSSSSRSALVYFVQDGSGKMDYALLSQDAYVPPADNYVFTWHNGSTSNKSESFQATGAVSAAITLVSTKNGSNHPWSTTSHPSWITIVSETATRVTIQASNNTGSARNGTIVLTQSGSNKTLEINVSQAAKPVTYNIVFTYELNDVVQQTLTWDIPTTSTTKTFSIPTPSGGWSSSDKISLSLQPSSPDIDWTGRTHELNNAPMKDTTDTLSIENKSSGITFNVVYSIEGAAVFTFADGSTFKKQHSVSQGDTHTYKTGIQPIISTVFGEKAGYTIGSYTVGIEVKTSTDNSVSVIVSKNTTGQPRTLYQEWNQWKSGNTGKTIRFEVDQAA